MSASATPGWGAPFANSQFFAESANFENGLDYYSVNPSFQYNFTDKIKLEGQVNLDRSTLFRQEPSYDFLSPPPRVLRSTTRTRAVSCRRYRRAPISTIRAWVGPARGQLDFSGSYTLPRLWGADAEVTFGASDITNQPIRQVFGYENAPYTVFFPGTTYYLGLRAKF